MQDRDSYFLARDICFCNREVSARGNYQVRFSQQDQTGTTFTGQNYGAKKFDRCKRSLKLCLIEGIVIEGIMVSCLLFFGRDLISIFTPNPELVEIGYVRVMFITTAHLLSLFYDVMSGY